MESPPSSLHDRAGGIVAAATVLALLYFGRDVLVPITLAVILSLAIAPLVRLLRRLGAGHTTSVLAAVLVVALAVAAVAAVIGMQFAMMTASLPQYELTIRRKLSALDELTVGPLNAMSGLPPQDVTAAPTAAPADAVPGQILQRPTTSLAVLKRVIGSVWVPLETGGIVIVVLIFVLLEREAVRDRFIRIAGGTDIRSTTLALNDAGERLSRFFVSQFRVNFGVAGAVSIGLFFAGLPNALLWGALTGVLRFVPYVGVWIAAAFSTLLGAAVDPGWSLAVEILALFLVVELIAGQLVEPRLYGHATGLSPLSVVIAAIFWSGLWGPIGLIVSTPLTLCLVVAGRHIKALNLLDVLLGDTQALTMPQRFYQRALSGDSQEIIAGARAFLKRNSFAAYCDRVLMPALALARLDLEMGAIIAEQQTRVRDVMVAVIAAIGGEGRLARRRMPLSVLDETAGQRLRRVRELTSGPYQGPLTVPPGSVILCVGLGSPADELATELLVRILRDQKVDARHVSIENLRAPPPPNASQGSVAVACLVSAFPSDERERGEDVADLVRRRFPAIRLVTVFLPGMVLQPGRAIDTIRSADKSATSFGHALEICLDMQGEKVKTAAPAAGAT
jgi:predicted PurR-regulated permease PerM